MLQDKIHRNRAIFEKERDMLQKKNNSLIELARIEKETFQKEKIIFTQQYNHIEKECELLQEEIESLTLCPVWMTKLSTLAVVITFVAFSLSNWILSTPCHFMTDELSKARCLLEEESSKMSALQLDLINCQDTFQATLFFSGICLASISFILFQRKGN